MRRTDTQGDLFKQSPDWGFASEPFDEIEKAVKEHDLYLASEAQTRFDVIDRIIREVLGWKHGQIHVEENDKNGFVDYILRSGDIVIVIEAKKAGAAFPSPTKRSKLKIFGSVLGKGDIAAAIQQAETYATSKKAQVVVVTNGYCWCFFSLQNKTPESYAYLVFPFHSDDGAEQLFHYLGEENVRGGSLGFITTGPLPSPENRLLSEVRDADARVDRNNIADHIAPALNNALYADALLNNREQLAACYVATEARTKFDKQLGMHLADPKPTAVEPAKRIKRRLNKDPLRDIVEESYTPTFAPPLTLIIGPVGAGKSTYLKHFELVSGSEILEKRKARWIYIDFEAMGLTGNPRRFMYDRLKEYLQRDHAANPIDYKHVIEPAYEKEIDSFRRGHHYLTYLHDKEGFNKVITDLISKDFEAVEPYVEKILSHLAQQELCVIILDNIDLYENTELEKTVFSEGLALSKRIHCHVIVSIRDKTFVRHRNDSAFDAYELRKLWLDPPPLEAVLAARLKYSQKILAGRAAKIALPNGATLSVPDVSVFFEIVQSSILSENTGEFIASIADINIRRGLELLTNFLTSGHTRAEEVLKGYMDARLHNNSRSDRWFNFPFHEVIKGCVLGQWKHYKETRASCINLFDSRLGSKKLRLLRLYILKHLAIRARSEATLEVPVSDCVGIFSQIGASEHQIVEVMNLLQRFGLIRNNDAEDINASSVVTISRSGGYYLHRLSRMFVYVELCLHDTAIEEAEAWRELSQWAQQVEKEHHHKARMSHRESRMKVFLDYLERQENETLALIGGAEYLPCMKDIKGSVLHELSLIQERLKGRRNKRVTP